MVDLVRILYDMLGGPRHYAAIPQGLRSVCLGMRRDLIVKRFPTASRLRQHLESCPELFS